MFWAILSRPRPKTFKTLELLEFLKELLESIGILLELFEFVKQNCYFDKKHMNSLRNSNNSNNIPIDSNNSLRNSNNSNVFKVLGDWPA